MFFHFAFTVFTEMHITSNWIVITCNFLLWVQSGCVPTKSRMESNETGVRRAAHLPIPVQCTSKELYSGGTSSPACFAHSNVQKGAAWEGSKCDHPINMKRLESGIRTYLATYNRTCSKTKRDSVLFIRVNIEQLCRLSQLVVFCVYDQMQRRLSGGH
jgi:hypothetical protein